MPLAITDLQRAVIRIARCFVPAKTKRPHRHRIVCEPLESRRLLATQSDAALDLPPVTISEIMYHAMTDRAEAEYLELQNLTDQPIQLRGWQFTRGVRFEFPAYLLGARQRVVVAADADYFHREYPEVRGVVGDWVGQLSNRGETIELVDANGNLVDLVRYADEGEWASRAVDQFEHGHPGWTWKADHDGQGASLELVNTRRSNDYGQNWEASSVANGSPGDVNSVASFQTAPLIVSVTHAPVIPTSQDPIVVTAHIHDEFIATTTAVLQYTIGGGTQVGRAIGMHDDGLGSDRHASDGIYTATIPAQPDQTIVQFSINSQNANGHQRLWPRVDANMAGLERPDALLQVLDSAVNAEHWIPDQPPATFLIMTAAERDALADIGDGPLGEAASNAQMNGTFIRVDGRGVHLRYFVGIRNRGGSSRIGPPNNYRVNFPHDRNWDEAAGLNFNSLFVAADILGNSLYRLAGMPAAVALPVRMFVNGADMADPSVPGMTSVYVQMEVIDSQFPDRHIPDDAGGNLYRAVARGTESGDLRYEGPDADAYRDTYSKRTNESEDDWSDLIRLTDALNNSGDDEFLQRIGEVIDVSQWMRFLALDALLGNLETGLSMRAGDNFWLYRGVVDDRFRLIPHDLDTIFGVGRAAQPNRSVFAYTSIPGLERLLTHPETVPLYYQAFRDLLDEVFNLEAIGPLIDQLRGFVSGEVLAEFEQFVSNRTKGVQAQLSDGLVVTSPLQRVDGFFRSSQPVAELVGTADAMTTRSVLVNGQVAQWSPLLREWSIQPVGDAETEELIGPNSDWSYFDAGTPLSSRWQRVEFDDASWLRGPAPLGYGLTGLRTQVSYGANPADRIVTTYFRRKFNVEDVDQINELTLRLQRDDGAIVYLNGHEVARSNMPSGDVDFQTVAEKWVGGQAFEQFHSFAVDPQLLQDGLNVVSVELHQRSPTDRDLWFDLSLEATVGRLEGGVRLRPGINRVIVQAMDGPDGSGTEIDRGHLDIWYDGGDIDTVRCDQLANTTNLIHGELRDVLQHDTTLAPCGSAYRVTNSVMIPSGVTLTILPGTTIFFDVDAGFTFDGGRLVADGTLYEPIRFTRAIGADGSWSGLQFVDSQRDSLISHAVIEYGATSNGMIGLERSVLTIDTVTFDHSDRFRIRTVDSSLIVRNSTFEQVFDDNQAPTTDNQSEHIWGSGILDGGQLIIEGNEFGSTKGHNDLIDFDGAARPGPIPVIRGNTFHGSGDDLLDLESDAHIEGNVFRNAIKDEFNTAVGEANAISAGGGRHFVVARNIFHHVDHAVQVKDDAFLTFQHNTVFNARVSAIYFDLEDRTAGRGARVEDSIIEATHVAFGSVEETTDLQIIRSNVPNSALRFGPNNSDEPARFVDPAAGDFRLSAGSPAVGTGGNGRDRGALVSSGVAISGEPPSLTALTTADLAVSGAGMTHYRFRLDDGPWSDAMEIDQPIALNQLADGPHRVTALGRNSAGEWQSADDATESRSWTVQTQMNGLRINEVLAANVDAVNVDGTYPDMIELFNAGHSAVDLSGMSLTDDRANPRRYVFPPSTYIAANSYLVLPYGVASESYPLTFNFRLQREGDSIFLLDAPERGGMVLDSVQFGLQLDDFSVGKSDSDLTWELNLPSLGHPNISPTFGGPDQVRINEWFTQGKARFNDDYIELYNSDSRPVALGGLVLTDDPVSQTQRHRIAALSYIGPHSFSLFRADRNVDRGADHLPFRLAADHGQLALLTEQGTIIDQVIYGWQSVDVSEGRFPDGHSQVTFQVVPTPGMPNRVLQNDQRQLVSWDAVWHMHVEQQPPDAAWNQSGFDDSSWPTGQGVLAAEEGGLPARIGTPLPLGSATYYFRHSFQTWGAIEDATFELTTLIDDGAVFYLNGTEFLRLGMSDGPIDHETRSNRGVGNAQFEGPFQLPAQLLQSGQNTLAVEVHQVSQNKSDVVFGVMLRQISRRSDAITDRFLSLLSGLRITELMYHPDEGESAEFVELANLSTESPDLSGVRISGGIEFEFGPNQIAAGDFVVLARDVVAFRTRYGAIDVAGQYRGSLSNRSDAVQLLLPDDSGVSILRFSYQGKWYPETDGGGYSLTVHDVNSGPATWSLRDHWRPSTILGGTPGREGQSQGDFNEDRQVTLADLNLICSAVASRAFDAQFDLNRDQRLNIMDVDHWLSIARTFPGDANLDGLFDSTDLVQVFRSGRYGDTSGDGRARWDEGDWNCDRQFSTDDLVAAFQAGRYFPEE